VPGRALRQPRDSPPARGGLWGLPSGPPVAATAGQFRAAAPPAGQGSRAAGPGWLTSSRQSG